MGIGANIFLNNSHNLKSGLRESEELGRTQKGFNLISPVRSSGNQIPNFLQP